MTCDVCDRPVASAHGLAVHRGMAHGIGPAHGTDSRYNAGCHCDDCREAHRRAAEQRRRRLGIPPLAEPRCGTPGGYQRHYHRAEQACGPCLAAHRAAARAHYHRAKRRRLRGTAAELVVDLLETHGRQTTGAIVSRIRARHSDIAENTITTALGRLTRRGVLERCAPDGPGYPVLWCLVVNPYEWA